LSPPACTARCCRNTSPLAHCTTITHYRLLSIANYCRVEENCAFLCYYASGSGNSLQTFRDNLSVSSLRFNNFRSFKKIPTGCPETSVRHYHYPLRNSPEGSSSQLLRGERSKSRTITIEKDRQAIMLSIIFDYNRLSVMSSMISKHYSMSKLLISIIIAYNRLSVMSSTIAKHYSTSELIISIIFDYNRLSVMSSMIGKHYST
jgi:hypothetical protein